MHIRQSAFLLVPAVILACLTLPAGVYGAQSPGTDSFGHSWTDSKLPAPQEPYAWVEIAPPEGGTGTEIAGLTSQDDAAVPVAIGFDFTFYGHTRSNVFVSSNGLLLFDSASAECDNVCIPDGTDPQAFIAAFWDDLDLGNNTNDGRVYSRTLGTAPNRQFVVEWYRVPHLDDVDSRFTFEAILYEGAGEGEIKVQYQTMSNGLGFFADGRAATLGIEDNSATRGVEYFCGSGGQGGAAPGPVIEGLAIRYSRTAGVGPRILVLQERCNLSPQRVFEALNNLGPTYAYVATINAVDFLDRLQNGGPWDLVIVDEYGDCLGGAVVSALTTYVGNGGRAIICYWDWGQSLCVGEGGLDALFGASYFSEYATPVNLYRWDLLHQIFNSPNSVPDFLSFTDPCTRDGARFNAAGGGVAVAGYTPAPAVNQHAIIIGNSDRTILNGEVFDVLDGNADADGKDDVVELIENEVLYLLPAAPPTFTNVTDDTTAIFLDWFLSRQTGTMFGDLELCNKTNSAKTMTAPFWYVVESNLVSYLMHPDGTEPSSGHPYVDITAAVEAALPGVGDGDTELDPGECVVVEDIEFYSRYRLPLVGMVYAIWADPPPGFGGRTAGQDADGDGMPDLWEVACNLNVSNPLDALGDADGDGLTALDEYYANTDPNDPGSCLRFNGAWPQGGDVWVKWVGGTGAFQYLMWSADSAGPWQALFTNRPMTDITNVFRHEPGAAPAGFYRVTVPRQP